MDLILIKMALTEVISFKEIPIKVSFNEYIEISKTIVLRIQKYLLMVF